MLFYEWRTHCVLIPWFLSNDQCKCIDQNCRQVVQKHDRHQMDQLVRIVPVAQVPNWFQSRIHQTVLCRFGCEVTPGYLVLRRRTEVVDRNFRSQRWYSITIKLVTIYKIMRNIYEMHLRCVSFWHIPSGRNDAVNAKVYRYHVRVCIRIAAQWPNNTSSSTRNYTCRPVEIINPTRYRFFVCWDNYSG